MKVILRIETSVPYLGGRVAHEVEISRTENPDADKSEFLAVRNLLEQAVEEECRGKLADAGITLDENGNRVEAPAP